MIGIGLAYKVNRYVTVCGGRRREVVAASAEDAAERSAEDGWTGDPPGEDDAVTVHVRAPDGTITSHSARASYRRVCTVEDSDDVPDAETAALLAEGA